MNETSQWFWSLLIVCLGMAWQMVDINGAIVPPPWSDPSKNPCATMPGGWQLLYWAPLQQCFKIFTVNLLFLHSFIHRILRFRLILNILCWCGYVLCMPTGWISMSRHNGIDSSRKQYKAKWHGGRVPVSAKHSVTSTCVQFDAML